MMFVKNMNKQITNWNVLQLQLLWFGDVRRYSMSPWKNKSFLAAFSVMVAASRTMQNELPVGLGTHQGDWDPTSIVSALGVTWVLLVRCKNSGMMQKKIIKQAVAKGDRLKCFCMCGLWPEPSGNAQLNWLKYLRLTARARGIKKGRSSYSATGLSNQEVHQLMKYP